MIHSPEVVADSSEQKPQVERGEDCEMATLSLASKLSLYSALLCCRHRATSLNIRLSIADRLFQHAENRLVPKHTLRRWAGGFTKLSRHQLSVLEESSAVIKLH
jgi:hypothetical protein